ncbi:hypothetical protein [Chitinophaga sp. MM2321]|uniref:hypothetical protein n=1 Tax=Chitinophaga sp. MM2321 TaxID=3137178 RepID=UPI0032D58130
MSAILQAACPYCGSTDTIRTIPEKDPFNIMVICNNCLRVVAGNESEAIRGKRAPVAARKAIAEQTVKLCLDNGKIHGVKYYYTEYNKLPGIEKIELLQAKEDVEMLLQSRGLTNAIKRPNKNGCVIVIIILLLITASVIYFFTHR